MTVPNPKRASSTKERWSAGSACEWRPGVPGPRAELLGRHQQGRNRLTRPDIAKLLVIVRSHLDLLGLPYRSKAALQQLLDAVNLLRDVAGRQAKHVADGRRVQILQVEEDHVAIDRFELPYQLAQPFGDGRFVVQALDRRFLRPLIELLEADQMRASGISMPAHEARGRVVRHAVDPGAQRALIPESREAAPDGDMDVLQQVLLQTTIPLIRGRQARDRRPKVGDGAGIEIVLTLAVGPRGP